VNQTLQVSNGNTGPDDGWRRQEDVGLRRQFEVVDRLLRDEDAIQRQDDAVVVLDVRGNVVIVRFGWMVVVFEVRVRHDLVATRTIRAVHVLHRGQRQAGQGGNEAQRDGAKEQH
jgi:hypothetical protein